MRPYLHRDATDPCLVDVALHSDVSFLTPRITPAVFDYIRLVRVPDDENAMIKLSAARTVKDATLIALEARLHVRVPIKALKDQKATADSTWSASMATETGPRVPTAATSCASLLAGTSTKLSMVATVRFARPVLQL
jgi:hypothetical protein